LPVSDGFLTYVIDALGCAGTAVPKRMFAGAGLYLDGLFFAIVADDVLYFKVDETNRKDYESGGMAPFRPFSDKPVTLSYYEVPAEVLEDGERLKAWVEKALGAARRARDKKS
jgi:DNA transformation protein